MTESTRTAHAPASPVREGSLQLQLLREGYRRGAPPQVKADTVEIDRQIASRMRCGQCRRRDLAYRPYHRGLVYRGVTCCARCGAEGEL
jgi:hypothetical protein